MNGEETKRLTQKDGKSSGRVKEGLGEGDHTVLDGKTPGIHQQRYSKVVYSTYCRKSSKHDRLPNHNLYPTFFNQSENYVRQIIFSLQQ